MKILNAEKLNNFIVKKPDAQNAIERWVQIVLDAEWKSHSDLKKVFPAADYVGNERYVFNIRGNRFRLVVVIVFAKGKLDVRFIGTHNDYDKIDCTTI